MKFRIFYSVSVLLIYGGVVWGAISSSSDYELFNSNISNSSSLSQSNDFTIVGSLGQNLADDNFKMIKRSSDYTLRTGFYDPPHLQFQKKLIASYQWGDERKIVLPQDSVELDRFDILWNDKNILTDPDVEEATRKISRIKGVHITPSKSFEVGFFDEEGFMTKLNKTAKISIKVEDSNGDGYVDGSKIKFKTLEGYIYDKEYKLWAKAFSSRVNYYGSDAIVDFELHSGGLVAVMGDIDMSVKDAYAYPVPFRPNGPKAGKCNGCSGTDEEGIIFTNLPQKGYIEIYTVDGRLVRKIIIDDTTIDESGGVSRIKWDTKNDEGEKVASGVYIWRVVSESYLAGYKNEKRGKLVIIR